MFLVDLLYSSRCCFLCIDRIWSLYSFLNQCLDAFYLIWNIFLPVFLQILLCIPYLLIMHILALHSIVSNLSFNLNWVHNFSWCIFSLEFLFYCFLKKLIHSFNFSSCHLFSEYISYCYFKSILIFYMWISFYYLLFFPSCPWSFFLIFWYN